MSSSLSAEHMAQMVPLLGSLARLIAGGSPLNESSLHTLLLGADLESNAAALDELRRWGRLLRAVRQQPTDEQRQATVEALRLRGLPEATVLLAVATVVGSGVGTTQAVASPPTPARLQASVTNLDFGNLRSGQGATQDFEVQGGPGQVIVESDQVQVTPTQFEAGPTRLRVAIKPLASGLLWTVLKLVTAGETLELPVVAQWQDEPAPAPPPHPDIGAPPPQQSSRQPQPLIQQSPPPVTVVSPLPQGVRPAPARRFPYIVVFLLLVGLGLGTVLNQNRSLPAAVRPTDAPIRATVIPTAAPTTAPVIPTPLPVWVPETVGVPAGYFLMGSSDADPQADSDEKPQHTLTLPTYWIGKTEVTNAQFQPFIEGDGYTNQTYWEAAGWQWRTDNNVSQPKCWSAQWRNGDTEPMVCVSWYEAMAYTRWLSVQTGQAFSLPTEAEWEKAARGTDGRIYPWGNTWETNRTNNGGAGLKKTVPVGQYPSGASPYGALDMAGNVWEWTRSVYSPYPYNPTDGREDLSNAAGKLFILRSGSDWNDRTYIRCGARDWAHPDNRGDGYGFRVVMSPPLVH